MLKTLFILSFISFLGLLGLYIFQTGNVVALSFEAKQIENRIEQAKDLNLSFKTDDANRFSMAMLDQKIAGLDFVPVKDIKYIEIPAKLLAAKRSD